MPPGLGKAQGQKWTSYPLPWRRCISLVFFRFFVFGPNNCRGISTEPCSWFPHHPFDLVHVVTKPSTGAGGEGARLPTVNWCSNSEGSCTGGRLHCKDGSLIEILRHLFVEYNLLLRVFVCICFSVNLAFFRVLYSIGGNVCHVGGSRQTRRLKPIQSQKRRQNRTR